MIKKKSRIPVKRKPVSDPAPKSDLEELKKFTFNVSTILPTIKLEKNIELSPPFNEIEPKNINKIFVLKCRECSKICDFLDENADINSKRDKASLLKHLVDIFTDIRLFKNLLPDAIRHFFDMILKNIQREFPPMKQTSDEVQDCYSDVNWPHISLVYDALYNLAESPIQFKPDRKIIRCLILLSNSPDADERNRVEEILLLLIKRNNFIQLVSTEITYSIGNNNISNELLNVFAEVFKITRNLSLFGFVLSLCSNNNFVSFSDLALILIQRFTLLDYSFFSRFLNFMEKHWPKATVKKQIILLIGIDSLINLHLDQVNEVEISIALRFIANALNQPNLSLVTTAINILYGPNSNLFFIQFAKQTISILLQPLTMSAKKHWDECVRINCLDLLELLHDSDQDEYQKASQELEKSKSHQKVVWKNKWTKIFGSAKLNYPAIRGLKLEISS